MVDIRAKLSNGLKQITGTLAGTKVAIDTVLIDPATGLPLETVPVFKNEVVTVIDNATFDQTVESEDIDFSKFQHAILTIKTGTATGSPTLTTSLQIKDSNGNYHTHTNLSPISTATTITPEEFFYLSAKDIRVVCTFGGSGSFATTTVELSMK